MIQSLFIATKNESRGATISLTLSQQRNHPTNTTKSWKMLRKLLLRYLFPWRRASPGAADDEDTIGDHDSDTFDDDLPSTLAFTDDSEVVVRQRIEHDTMNSIHDYRQKVIQLEIEVSRLKEELRASVLMEDKMKVYRLTYAGVTFINITGQNIKDKVKNHFHEIWWQRLGYTHKLSSPFGQSYFATCIVKTLQNQNVPLEDVFGWCQRNVKVEIMVRQRSRSNHSFSYASQDAHLSVND